MPRPKRTRAVATRPAKAPSPAPESSATPAIAPKPTTAQPEFSGSDIYDVSDREKELIRKRMAEAEARQPRRTRTSQHLEADSEQTRALQDSKRRRDDAMNRLDNLTSTSRPDHTDSPDISSDMENTRRESITELVQPRLTDASGLDLDDELFANLDDSLDDTENAIQDTRASYRSTDTSTFNVAMFKRRPRQSSVAGRGDAPIRPSSRGQNTLGISSTLNFGNFKRRAREPSILGTARKARRERSQSVTSQASQNARLLDDGEDSGPEGESTPLDKTRRQTRASLAASGAGDGSPVLPSRKRKSLESHDDGREKRAAVDTEPVEAEEEAEDIHQSIEVEMTPDLSPARGRALERERFSTPVQEDDDPDMAPPLSSSSESNSSAAWPSMDTLTHRTYTPKPAPKKKAPAPQKKNVTTADLTSLLPRRKAKTSNRMSDSTDPFDLDASDDERDAISGNDEDETPYADSRAARRRKQPATSKSNRKGKAAEVANNGGSRKRGMRTYGSMAAEEEHDEEVEETIVVGSGGDEEEGSGEEGEGEEELPEEETSQMMTERLGEELQQAKKKFKEVDKWELSFEEVTHSSSPGPDAR
ncbi:hypothetical protein N0V88_001622 [Collariella sp. IMI 366227]|nr:hypothetical protein N0V88_001622 [Collariella sp. IMI 366227]